MDLLLTQRAILENDLVSATEERDQIAIYVLLQENLEKIHALQD